MRSIKEAGIGKRLIALIMDIALAFLAWGLLASQVTARIATKTMKMDENGALGLKYEVCSMLYVYEEAQEDGTKKIITPDLLSDVKGETTITVLYEYKNQDISFYKERLKYYYLNFKTGNNVLCPEGKDPYEYCAPNYNDKIGDKSPTEVYTETWFNENFGSQTDVNEFLKKEVYSAVKDLNEQPYLIQINKNIMKVQMFIVLPPYALCFIGFFILTPALFKNGETFGKKIMHIGFVTKDGYDIKRRQIVLRQTILFLYTSLCAFIVGVGLTSIATLGVGIVIYIIATLISKTKRSPVDYFAYTYLIDTQSSVWFSDEDEENDKESELAKNMTKYRKGKVIDKTVIQVGGTIINEDVKRQIEEENSKISKE